MILLIASVTLCEAATLRHRRRSHKRGVQYEEFGAANYQNPSQHDSWSTQQFDSAQQFDTDPSNEEEEEDDSQSYDQHSHHQEQQDQQQFDELGAWDDEKLTKSPAKSEWNSQWPGSSGWSTLGNPVKSKTIIKKIPVPYDRPIKIENPIYTPVEKHIPIEHPVPVVKWVEKRVPLYQDHPVLQPIVKEERVPQPYDQKVRVILQKVYVHVPSPPVKQTIIIRKKLARRHGNSDKRRKHFYGWL